MKGVLFCIIILFLLPSVFAIEINMNSDFNQSETLIAHFTGNFLNPLLKENIHFYRRHIEIPMEYEFSKTGNNYFIYAQLSGRNPDNYSMVLEDVRYEKGSGFSEEDVVKNFSINSYSSDFYVTPGFVITENDFSIKIKNIKDIPIQIEKSIGISNETEESNFFDILFGGGKSENETEIIILAPGEEKEIEFEIEDFPQGLEVIELSTNITKYQIPVYDLSEGDNKTDVKSFRFEPSELNFSMPTDSEVVRKIYLYNNGGQDIKNINLSVSDSLKKYTNFSGVNIENLSSGESQKIVLFFSSSEKEISVDGEINAETNDSSISLPVSINFLKDYTPSEDYEVEDPAKLKTCEELGGEICDDGEKCSDKTQYAKDGNCCLGDCEKTEEGSTGKIIGWLIIIVVLVFVIWFFKTKYSKTKHKKVNLLGIGKK